MIKSIRNRSKVSVLQNQLMSLLHLKQRMPHNVRIQFPEGRVLSLILNANNVQVPCNGDGGELSSTLLVLQFFAALVMLCFGMNETLQRTDGLHLTF